ncbi:uncharacterized protein LOC132886465 [Neoarius graeffei]|uniref:uncharacterized protein LOC132886465 n=1 Tax=Neoarius graeffei TaxID=443677 RepID=UPI00298CB7B2|nr:uncharacterized protein LOC132886465 [Neoarius graeffei]
MAASRDVQGEAHQPDPRPSRRRQPPAYLEDYVLYHPRQSSPFRPHMRSTGHATHASQSNISFPSEGATAARASVLDRLEERWRSLSTEMEQLTVEMENAKRASYPLSTMGFSHEHPRLTSPYHQYSSSLPHSFGHAPVTTTHTGDRPPSDYMLAPQTLWTKSPSHTYVQELNPFLSQPLIQSTSSMLQGAASRVGSWLDMTDHHRPLATMVGLTKHAASVPSDGTSTPASYGSPERASIEHYPVASLAPQPAPAPALPLLGQPAPIPAQPPPGQPAPASPLPGQPAPASPLPGQPAPASPLPGQPAPALPLLGQPAPAQPLPGQPVPMQPPPIQLYPPVQLPAGPWYPPYGIPQPGHYPWYPYLYHVPQPAAYPAADTGAPNLMEMAIASSYGIPKPKLVAFSSGKESDFILLKKGLDTVLGPHRHLTEDYKFQVLLDLVKLPAAYQIAKRHLNSPQPYSAAMQALEQRYGQPRSLIQSELKALQQAPAVRMGDAQALEDFSTAVSSLVGMLQSTSGPARYELQCGSHVDILLSKLPMSYRDSFVEHCLKRGIIASGSAMTYTLIDLASWLEIKSQTLQISRRATEGIQGEPARRDTKSSKQTKVKSSTVLLNTAATLKATAPSTSPKHKRERFKPFCPYCKSNEHYLSSEFTSMNTSQKSDWIKEQNRCWRCGRGHKPDKCTLKKPCVSCGEQHLLT